MIFFIKVLDITSEGSMEQTSPKGMLARQAWMEEDHDMTKKSYQFEDSKAELRDKKDGSKELTKQLTLRGMSETHLFEKEIEYLNNQLMKHNPKKNVLRDLDMFVLDNSLRETTVGQLRGHTIESKQKIYHQVCYILFQNISSPTMFKLRITYVFTLCNLAR